jgi:hypothetical protein
MKKGFLLILFLLLIPVVTAWASPIIMDNGYVRTAISDDGTLGYGSSISPGLLHDTTGTSNYRADDYLTPGTPWETFSVYSTQTGLLSNYNHTIDSISTTSGPTAVTSSNVTWLGEYSSFFSINHDYTLNTGSERIDIVTTIIALSDLTGLQFLRAIDPDPDVNTYSNYDTVNGRGYDANGDGDFDDAGDVAPENWVHSEGLSTGLTLGLYSDSDITHNTGVSSGWSYSPSAYLGAIDDGNGDFTIGIGFDIGNLASGNSASFAYSYVMGGSLGTADVPDNNPPAVPEPTTMILFGIGLLGLAGTARRKN